MLEKPNILISSGGRRVALMNCFRESLRAAGIPGWVGVVDAGESAPVSFLADKAWRVPPCTSPDFLPAVLDICATNSVGLVIPTIDTELPGYAQGRAKFEEIRTRIAVSGSATVHLACDKRATHKWLTECGFPGVRQADIRDVLSSPENWAPPFIAKPCNGSASIGVRKIESLPQLELLAASGVQHLVEELAPGREFTANFYVDRKGKCIAVVPHWRLEVRAGEVSKGMTFRHDELESLIRRIAAALPDAYGALNAQGFVDNSGAIRLIELNARFGGGYPLAHAAGARFTDWLVAELSGTDLSAVNNWTEDLLMLRYDDAVFLQGASLRAQP